MKIKFTSPVYLDSLLLSVMVLPSIAIQVSSYRISVLTSTDYDSIYKYLIIGIYTGAIFSAIIGVVCCFTSGNVKIIVSTHTSLYIVSFNNIRKLCDYCELKESGDLIFYKNAVQIFRDYDIHTVPFIGWIFFRKPPRRLTIFKHSKI